MRRAARTDSTHAEIVKALRQVGCQVFDASRIGGGFPDLVVRVPWAAAVQVNGVKVLAGGSQVLLMEVKTPRGKLTTEQQDFMTRWPEVVVVRSVSDALSVIGISG